MRILEPIVSELAGGDIRLDESVWDRLSYSPLELEDYIEGKFYGGMSWDNFGQDWILGYVIPRDVLPYSSLDSDNFEKCWSLFNLRPVKVDGLSSPSAFRGRRWGSSLGGTEAFTLKPWGAELIWAKTPSYVGKVLLVTRGSKLSLQHHEVKEETMFVKSGVIILHYGQDLDSMSKVTLAENDSFHIPPGTIHRVEAVEDSSILEVSTIELNDIVRHEDDYGREVLKPEWRVLKNKKQ